MREGGRIIRRDRRERFLSATTCVRKIIMIAGTGYVGETEGYVERGKIKCAEVFLGPVYEVFRNTSRIDF